MLTLRAQLPAVTVPQVPQPNVKLRPLDLPHFNGKISEWRSYRDRFISAIHNQVGMSKVDKLQYLRTTLSGEPERVIMNIETTEGNYDRAWQMLVDRYDNVKTIIETHIKAIVNSPSITSEAGLRKLVDTFQQNVEALEVLEEPVEHWDSMLVFLLAEKLDHESRRAWELSLTDTDHRMPKYETMTKFLESRIRALSSVKGASNPKQAETVSKTSKPVRSSEKQTLTYHATPSSKLACEVCQESHKIFRCPTYKAASINSRTELLRNNSLCFNCLRPGGHFARECNDPNRCHVCGEKHHTTIHRSNSNGESASGNAQAPVVEQTVVASHLTSNQSLKQVLLCTVIVKVSDQSGNQHNLRALLDNGSQSSFITERAAQLLQLKRTRCGVSINGVGTAKSAVQGQTVLKLQSMNSNYSITIQALILNKITSKLPNSKIEQTEHWAHLKNLNLADPQFHIPSSIDLLLGAEVVSEIALDGKLPSLNGSPVAHNTQFGWVLSGALNLESQTVVSYHCVTNLNDELKQFWALDQVPDAIPMSQEEKVCEIHFDKTHSRDPTGRFVVQLPFKCETIDYGNSLGVATKRQLQVERQLARQPDRRQLYREFMKEYEELGHMVQVPKIELSKPTTDLYYIPHHSVMKECSTTTKLRVVFDGSANTNAGTSLNDNLMVGPKLHQDLHAILLRFRQHRVAFTADIAKMYRQVNVAEDHQDFQRIIWRDSPEMPMQHFRLTTVTYGTASAPYLAVKSLQQLANDEKCEMPKAAEVLLKDCYVDDVMSGADSVPQAIELIHELVQLTESGQFHLRKWSSNESTVFDSLPQRDVKADLENSSLNSDVKVLGILWQPASDAFKFTVNSPELTTYTKRQVLSDIARIFDPLGWLSPVVVKAKLIMQHLWLSGCSWDDEIPNDLSQEWVKLKQTLTELELVEIPRAVLPKAPCVNLQLHGFSDASQSAYGAVIYLRAQEANGQVTTNLLCAKTRVAPIKTISLPRLELCAAFLLSKLVDFVCQTLTLDFEKIVCWTDSTIVLAWLNGHPNRWTTFVANRTSEILNVVAPEQWNHVPTDVNPADCSSRGLFPAEFTQHSLWWHGPPYLLQGEEYWPKLNPEQCSTNLEQRTVKVTTLVTQTRKNVLQLEDYSSFTTLIRITAYCLRFIRNCRAKTHTEPKLDGNLGPVELQQATTYWVKRVQEQEFGDEIDDLQANQPMSKKSRLLSLAPFLDDFGVVRVGGRLRNAEIPYEKKHPILLPKGHYFTKLIVNYFHLKHLHAGPRLLLAIILDQYWITNCRDLVRQFVKNCVICARQAAIPVSQLMGDLPAQRVVPSRPFLRCGVDYCGPFTIRLNRLRGKALVSGKCYIAVFVCMVTKAIHLELVSELSSDAFVATLKRFFSRRGKSLDIFSDCGTNFVGAQKDLKYFLTDKAVKEGIYRFTAAENTNWHFIPPGSPHMGGIWEAGVKSAKYHLRRVMGNGVLTYEDMTTLITQVEACLNSRPLCQMSSDPNELSVLTPGHFLVGDSLIAIPEPNYTNISSSRLTHWQHTQQLVQHFWKKWSQDVLSGLQQRCKWTSVKPNLEVGTLVLLKEENLPPLKWCMGRVSALHPGKDKLVRVVSVKTAHGVIKRTVAKVCPLPVK